MIRCTAALGYRLARLAVIPRGLLKWGLITYMTVLRHDNSVV